MRNIFSKELRQEVWYTIKTNKRRTFFTSLGVFAGMFFFTLLTGLGNGIRNSIDSTIEGVSSDMMLVMPGRTTLPYEGFKANRDILTDYSDYEFLSKRVSTVGTIAATSPWGGMWDSPNIRLNGKALAFTVMGLSSNFYPDIAQNIVVYGRNMRSEEIAAGDYICVIGTKVAENFFGKDKIRDAVGKVLTVDGISFKVVGVAKPYSDDVTFGFNQDWSVVVPISIATQGNPTRFTLIYYTPKPGLDKKAAEEEILPLLFKRHKINPKDDKVFSTFGMDTFLSIFEMIEKIINVLIWVIGLGTLFSGVISVSNILLVTVRERQREIGVRRAIGAKPGDIRLQFMLEAVFIILLAGMAGLVFGLLVVLGIGTVTEGTSVGDFLIRPYPSARILVFSLVVMGLSGVLAGLLPVYKALQIKAIDAIRDE
ncbi:MAG: ABC transporter permease [Bacteroidales bacterium]|nr:ABC transporter permease [Bacteroidales bacterium]